MTDTTIVQDAGDLTEPVERSDELILSGLAEDLKEYSTENVNSDTCEDVQVISNCEHLEDINQCSPTPHQPTQPTALCTEFRRPLVHAKRRLSFNHINENSTTTSKVYSCVKDSEVAKTNHLIDGYSDNSQQRGSDGSSTVPLSCIETDSVKISGHIRSPTSSSYKTIASSMAVSPLTKAFRAFHMHQSQPTLEMQHSYSPSMSPSTPVLIPSFSFPCLLAPHPITPPFTSPCHDSKSPSSSRVSPKAPPAACSDSNSVKNCEPPQHKVAQSISQPSPTVGVTTSDKVVYTTPTTSSTYCSTSSMKSDFNSPSSSPQLRPLHGKTGGASSVGAMVKLHKHLTAHGGRVAKLNTRNYNSHSKTAHLKQVLMHGSSKQHVQQKSQPSLRCPRKIQCNNCGHKIDLTNYVHNPQMPVDVESGSSVGTRQGGKSVPSKSNATNSGLTVFDLETICDTGCIEHSSPAPTVRDSSLTERQTFSAKQHNDILSGVATELGNNDYTKGQSKTYYTPFYDVSLGDITLPPFPHSDELTKSFAPIFSDTVNHNDQNYNLAERWDKLDSLDVDEILQLLEATSEIMYCNKSRPIVSKGTANANGWSFNGDEVQKQQLESVLPANHIVTETARCHEGYNGSLYSTKGKTNREGHCSKNLDMHGSNTSVANSFDLDRKSDSTDSEGDAHVQTGNSSSRDELCTICGDNLKDKTTSCTELQSSTNVNKLFSNPLPTSTNVAGKNDSEGNVQFQESSVRVLRNRIKQTRTSRICKKRPRKKQSKKTKVNKKPVESHTDGASASNQDEK